MQIFFLILILHVFDIDTFMECKFNISLLRVTLINIGKQKRAGNFDL